MGISQIFSSNTVKAVTNFVKANPVTTAVGVGAAGLIGYRAATITPKENVEIMNRTILTHPFINPMGFIYHTLNPLDISPNTLDGPIVKYIVDKNNEKLNCYV